MHHIPRKSAAKNENTPTTIAIEVRTKLINHMFLATAKANVKDVQNVAQAQKPEANFYKKRF